jgi:recombination protein RecT
MSNEVAVKPKVTIQSLVHNQEFISKAKDTLGEGARQFLASVLTLANSDDKIKACDPIKLYNCCLMAAAIKLPFNQNLGQAYIIPYKSEPQLQIGWKGYVQLAQRSGLYRTINVDDVRVGEIKSHDRLVGEITFDWINDDDVRVRTPIIGYVAYFELLNGFRKMHYMTKAELERHAEKYSMTYRRNFGVWKDDFDAMARKTVIKLLLSKFAPLSIGNDIAKAIDIDQSDSEGNYVDNQLPKVEVIDANLGDSEEERNKQLNKSKE